MDIYKEAMESYNRDEGRVCAKEGEGISIVEGREGGDAQVHI